ncbi:MAG: hypothetical protein ABIE43_01710 [Patescibacteria group bacterium]
MLNIVLFPVYFVMARAVRLALKIWGPQPNLKMVGISNYRGVFDVIKFGFLFIWMAPKVLSWARFSWDGIQGRLYMIRVTDNQLKKAYKLAQDGNMRLVEKYKKLFCQCVSVAKSDGATEILVAAGLKRLFASGELKEKFPEMNFGIGDNFTGILLGAKIAEVFRYFKIKIQSAVVLIIAPHGFLGGVSLFFCKKLGVGEIYGMGNPKSNTKKDFKALADKEGFIPIFGYEELGGDTKIDLVIACANSKGVKLTQKIINQIRRPDHLVAICDPCEPNFMTKAEFHKLEHVVRFDAGNGWSPRLQYVLGGIVPWLLQLMLHELWGCFCEQLLITKHTVLQGIDWFKVNPKNMELVSQFLGEDEGQFGLTPLVSFGKRVTATSLKVTKPAKEWPSLFKPALSIARTLGLL